MEPVISVGTQLRTLRRERELSQRDLAECAGLSANAVSLIERDEISPSVATLQRLAAALSVKMSYFFETDERASVIHVRAGQRPTVSSRGVTIEGIGTQLEGQQMEPYVLTLAPHAGTGGGNVIHSGHEFVYCLKGPVEYQVDGTSYLLEAGDTLLFEASLPHYWQNPGDEDARFLLVLQAPGGPHDPARRHFLNHPSIVHMGGAGESG